MNEKNILLGYEYAKEAYAAIGVDVDAAMQKADAIPVSMHCWQGDDVIGYDGSDSLSGGIQTTGNYIGRARTADELRGDIDFARTMIPGATKLNLHASYAEKNGKKVDRDEYTIEQFQNWVDWAKEKKLGLDFNPTYFAHPMMDGDFSLSSANETKRRFWVEHGKRCREIGNEFYKQLGQPCAINYWMPDGMKDITVGTKAFRDRMTKSLDEIFADKSISQENVPCGLESKLFGIGSESYVPGSNEFYWAYVVQHPELLITMDAGHFHPTELISSKISTVLCFAEKMLLHVSRPVRWDSDHVVLLDDETRQIMREVVRADALERVYIALDYFDASINRVIAWTVGARNARKALLAALLEPVATLKKLEAEGDRSSRLALQQELLTMPMGAVWDEFCERQGVPVGTKWLEDAKKYEQEITIKR